MRLDDAKRVYRDVLDKNVRFSSHSKGKYTKKVYKSLYGSRGFSKNLVDELLDDVVINVDGEIVDIKFIELVFLRLLLQVKNKSESIECYQCANNAHYTPSLFEWWTYGKLWRDSG